jgi:hypothetical protein
MEEEEGTGGGEPIEGVTVVVVILDNGLFVVNSVLTSKETEFVVSGSPGIVVVVVVVSCFTGTGSLFTSMLEVVTGFCGVADACEGGEDSVIVLEEVS